MRSYADNRLLLLLLHYFPTGYFRETQFFRVFCQTGVDTFTHATYNGDRFFHEVTNSAKQKAKGDTKDDNSSKSTHEPL